MGAPKLAFEVGTESTDLREARLRAEVRGECCPRLHAMMIDDLEAAADALNAGDCPLSGSYHAIGDEDNEGVAAGVEALIELIAEEREEHEKAIAEAKALAKEAEDLAGERYDAMVAERNAWQDKAHAADEARRACERDGREIDAKHFARIREQERTIAVLARAVHAGRAVLADVLEDDVAIVLAASVQESAEAAARAANAQAAAVASPRKGPRRRVRKP